MIIFIVVALAFISFLLALNSLRSLNNKREIEEAKKALSKGRVIYQDSSSSE